MASRAVKSGKAASIALALLLGGCTMGQQLHVTHSEDPKFIDRDVRFRTTYYFRVFDYCTAKQAGADGTANPNPLANIIPSTEALYRYRMTGRASALATKIRFESGVLKDWQIDPWGARASFDQAENPTFTAAPAAVARTAPAEDAGQRIKAILEVMAGLDAKTDKAPLQGALVTLLSALAGTVVPDSDVARLNADMLGKFEADLDKAEADGRSEYLKVIEKATLANEYSTEAEKAAADKAAKAEQEKKEASGKKAAIDRAAVALSTLIQTSGNECGFGRQQRRGFQVLGPEGVRQFDPSDRLIMGVTFSAKPLIATLQEYSARVSNPQAATSDKLLPLVRENLVLSQARSAAATAKPADSSFDTIFDAATKALKPSPVTGAAK